VVRRPEHRPVGTGPGPVQDDPACPHPAGNGAAGD
jgi:hypothetical protein